jgi:hypothetical protein
VVKQQINLSPFPFLLAAALAAGGCAHAGLPAGREVVWEGVVQVRADVVIPAGDVLVIRPGTKVVFAFRDDDGDGAGDARILVKGRLRAIGRADAPIEFAAEAGGAHPGPRWGEVLVEEAAGADFAWCRFSGAQQAVHAHFTPLAIDRCVFEGNAIGARFRGDPVTIRHSRFAGNGTAVRFWESSPEVADCEFTGNGTGVFVRENAPRTVLRGNNFLSSLDYHVKLGEAQPCDVEAPGNWWGTAQGDQIERLLYDRLDADYLGRVRYDPPAAGPLPGAGP